MPAAVRRENNSGPAGQRGAVQAAKLGKRVAIIEKQRAVGGVQGRHDQRPAQKALGVSDGRNGHVDPATRPREGRQFRRHHDGGHVLGIKIAGVHLEPQTGHDGLQRLPRQPEIAIPRPRQTHRIRRFQRRMPFGQ